MLIGDRNTSPSPESPEGPKLCELRVGGVRRAGATARKRNQRYRTPARCRECRHVFLSCSRCRLLRRRGFRDSPRSGKAWAATLAQPRHQPVRGHCRARLPFHEGGRQVQPWFSSPLATWDCPRTFRPPPPPPPPPLLERSQDPGPRAVFGRFASGVVSRPKGCKCKFMNQLDIQFAVMR